MLDAEVINEPLVDALHYTESEIKNKKVTMVDPEWTDYVLGQLEDNELDNGFPKVHGLIRLTRKLIGPIIETSVNTKQVPTIENEGRATVEMTVTVLNKYNLDKGEKPYIIKYGDVADYYHGNARGSIEYQRFPPQNAATRALVRALRRILSIDVVASEEISDQPPEEAAMTGPIKESQINKIDILCSNNRLDIDVMKFVNMGKKKFDKIEDVTNITAIKMFGLLNEYQRNVKPIPDGIKGYKPNWRGDLE